MTNSEIFKAAHAEAKAIIANRRYSQGPISYAEAFKYGLRRIYNQIEKDKWMALPRQEKPKFMWLRGM